MAHICVRNLTIMVSDNGLSPGRRQAIIWTNAGILLIGPLGTKFSEIVIIVIEIQTFSLKKMRLKMSSAKCCTFRLGLNVLTFVWVDFHCRFMKCLDMSPLHWKNRGLRWLPGEVEGYFNWCLVLVWQFMDHSATVINFYIDWAWNSFIGCFRRGFNCCRKQYQITFNSYRVWIIILLCSSNFLKE